MSCCPPNSHKYLAAEYSGVGKEITLPDGTEVYVTGTSAGKNAVLIIPDVWGWNGGRTRNIADQFAEAGYYAVVPKLLLPNLRGGTHGDGLPPDFDIMASWNEFVEFLKLIPWEGGLKPKIDSTIKHLKDSGVNKIVSMGFCWGGFVLAQVLDEYSNDIECGVIPHPSFQLADVLGGSSVELVKKIKKPLLLLPAGNDGDNIKLGGELINLLQINNPLSETTNDFNDMQHGWSCRGDTKDENIRIKVELALNKTYAYFAKFV